MNNNTKQNMMARHYHDSYNSPNSISGVHMRVVD